jgi:pimeloyl-ACP methyl ester carboxylesterase
MMTPTRNGNSLILIPGLLNTADLWRDQTAGLADTSEIYVTSEHYAYDNIPEIAARILQRAPERFALAGLSMGGYIAFEILRQALARVTKLALLDTTARPDAPEKAVQRRETIRVAREHGLQRVRESMQPNLLHAKHLKDQSILLRLGRMAEQVGVDGFERQQTAIMDRVDSRPLLQEIHCPTLVLCGRQDTLTPMELAQEMADGIANSRLIVVEECGHLSAIEQPARVTDAMREWLTNRE